MLITCPQCHTKYNVPFSLENPEQKVKCVKCGCIWNTSGQTITNEYDIDIKGNNQHVLLKEKISAQQTEKNSTTSFSPSQAPLNAIPDEGNRGNTFPSSQAPLNAIPDEGNRGNPFTPSQAPLNAIPDEGNRGNPFTPSQTPLDAIPDEGNRGNPFTPSQTPLHETPDEGNIDSQFTNKNLASDQIPLQEENFYTLMQNEAKDSSSPEEKSDIPVNDEFDLDPQSLQNFFSIPVKKEPFFLKWIKPLYFLSLLFIATSIYLFFFQKPLRAPVTLQAISHEFVQKKYKDYLVLKAIAFNNTDKNIYPQTFYIQFKDNDNHTITSVEVPSPVNVLPAHGMDKIEIQIEHLPVQSGRIVMSLKNFRKS